MLILNPFGFQRLKDDAGAATLENVVEAAAKVAFLRGLDLPHEFLDGIDQGWLVRRARLVEGETSSEMRRHDRVLRLGLLAVYLMDRQGKLIDGLIDLLVELVHRLGMRSRRKVIAGIAADIGAVHGKERLLVDIALASLESPEGRIADVIFPVAGAGKLQAVIDEYRAHALHLLQASLVYVNTRMVQSVLRRPTRSDRLSPEDYRGLTPIIYAHINPYGRFEVDLDQRINFDQVAA